jgi:hypothetical protein
MLQSHKIKCTSLPETMPGSIPPTRAIEYYCIPRLQRRSSSHVARACNCRLLRYMPARIRCSRSLFHHSTHRRVIPVIALHPFIKDHDTRRECCTIRLLCFVKRELQSSFDKPDLGCFHTVLVPVPGIGSARDKTDNGCSFHCLFVCLLHERSYLGIRWVEVKLL